jgi:electron transport complex protein RnfD
VGTLRTDFLVALLPLLGWSVYLYGLRPLTLTLIAVLSSCLLDMGCQAILRHRFFLDTDAVVIGALIALGLPPTAPLWLPCAAAAIAILPVRLILKGRLRRFVNPAALALLVLTLALPAVMGSFAATGERLSPFAMTAEGFTEAGESILDVTLNGGLPETETLASTFFGLRHGRIGESSVLLLLAAALYLGFRKQLRIWFPAFFLLAAGVLLYLFPRTAVASDMIALRFVGYQLMGTEMLFGALFLASDSFTAPRSPRVAILCGLLGGAMTVGLRYYVEPQVAVLGAVLAVGLLATPLEILLRPAVFGGRRKKKKSSPPTHTPEAVA